MYEVLKIKLMNGKLLVSSSFKKSITNIFIVRSKTYYDYVEIV